MITSLIAAFLLGLVSASHCMGMCGGLMLAAGINSQKISFAVFYNIGRVTTYSLLGLVFGLFSEFIPRQTLPLLQVISASLLVLTALYLVGITPIIQKIEYLGKPIWRIAQPLAKKVLPVTTPANAWTLGLLWGFIPCGLVYTALTFSVTLSDVSASALAMLCFGLGTFPAMLGTSLLAQQLRPWLTHRVVKTGFALLMLAMAVFILLPVFT